QGASFHMGSTREGLLSSPLASEGTRTGFYTDEFVDQHFKPPEEIRKANLRGCDLRGAQIDGVDFYLVDLRDALLDAQQIDYLRKCGAILSSAEGSSCPAKPGRRRAVGPAAMPCDSGGVPAAHAAAPRAPGVVRFVAQLAAERRGVRKPADTRPEPVGIPIVPPAVNRRRIEGPAPIEGRCGETRIDLFVKTLERARDRPTDVPGEFCFHPRRIADQFLVSHNGGLRKLRRPGPEVPGRPPPSRAAGVLPRPAAVERRQHRTRVAHHQQKARLRR